VPVTLCRDGGDDRVCGDAARCGGRTRHDTAYERPGKVEAKLEMPMLASTVSTVTPMVADLAVDDARARLP